MEVEYAFLARHYEKNPDGSVNIFSIFDRIQLSGPPYNIAPVVYVAGFSILPTELDQNKTLRLRIGYATSDVPIYEETKEYRTPSLQAWAHHNESIGFYYVAALELPEPAEYIFQLYIENVSAATTWLRIYDTQEAVNA